LDKASERRVDLTASNEKQPCRDECGVSWRCVQLAAAPICFAGEKLGSSSGEPTLEVSPKFRATCKRLLNDVKHWAVSIEVRKHGPAMEL
jgi:hypothetical protein